MTYRTTKSLRPVAASLLALGLSLPLAASPALAGEQEQIRVTTQGEMQRWQDRATRRLDNALRQAPGRSSAVPKSGIVQIAFRMGEDGRPDGLTVHSNTADRTALRMAKYAVRRLGDLSDVPVGNAHRAQFLANIVFATDRVEHKQLMLALAQSERARLAAGEAGSDLIVLGG
ncbi:hypothetical protein [Erythrobacter sp.]|uniref:hypothetical protein n=1 Tax=Erythrobacter sp. TaxID=1042 RepID=UPI001425F548|nr:hypothetical protein [Erythrobacter sp.]QIQ87249.1 MAG: hypothetical protein G9473_11555 [Erythrobacter sp.]